ncbi:meiosis-specific protein MEI4 [Silurus meridionalis]|nr:meiosis-specific protein MEI4 [Silurus meridionalis]
MVIQRRTLHNQDSQKSITETMLNVKVVSYEQIRISGKRFHSDCRVGFTTRQSKSINMNSTRHEAWSIRRARLGVALAVIKSKPAGQSGREHAENLVSKLKQQEETWKRKAEELQDQVLSLRQELLLVKLLSKQRKGAESSQGDDVFKLLSQDLTEAQHSENDSGCDTQTLSLTPDPADPAAPRSIHFNLSFDRDPWGHALSKHMRFLQNLCALRSTGKNMHMDRGDAVIEDTAVNMIESIVEAHQAGGEGDVSQLRPLVQASRLVALALKGGFGKRDALEKAEELLDELLEILLNNSQLNKVAVQDNLTECLICLGGATALRAALVNLVLTRIVRLAEHLWTGCQNLLQIRFLLLGDDHNTDRKFRGFKPQDRQAAALGPLSNAFNALCSMGRRIMEQAVKLFL